MPVSRERFAALRWSGQAESVFRTLRRGETLTVRLGGKDSVGATVEALVEQWGSSNPEVQVGVLVRISANGLAKFEATRNDYFLAYEGAEPSILTEARPEQISGARQVLNRFGETGEILLARADVGWEVALWRRFSGKLMRTDIAYSYGD